MIYCTAIKGPRGYEPLGELANTAVGHSMERAKEIARDFNSPAFKHLSSRAVVVPLPRIAALKSTAAQEGGERS